LREPAPLLEPDDRIVRRVHHQGWDMNGRCNMTDVDLAPHAHERDRGCGEAEERSSRPSQSMSAGSCARLGAKKTAAGSPQLISPASTRSMLWSYSSRVDCPQGQSSVVISLTSPPQKISAAV